MASIHARMFLMLCPVSHIFLCSAIEEMAGMDMLCSDKTGTLTLNKMVIQDDCPTYTPVSSSPCVHVLSDQDRLRSSACILKFPYIFCTAPCVNTCVSN